MNAARKLVALTLMAAMMGTSLAGCEERTRNEQRPDPDRIMGGDRGPQSRDVHEMAARMVPSILANSVIAQNPNQITVVVKHLDNKTEDMYGRNLDIYLANLSSDLSAVSPGRITFIEEERIRQGIANEELGGTAAAAGAGRITPQYALYGTVYSMVNRQTSYYLFQFKLTNITTGVTVWTGKYDVRTLN